MKESVRLPKPKLDWAVGLGVVAAWCKLVIDANLRQIPPQVVGIQ